MKRNSSLRKGRFSEPGRIYLVTFVTQDRKPIFYNFSCGRIVVNSIRHQESRSKTLAYTVMPDHVHWLLQLQETPLKILIHSVKSYSSLQINKQLNGTGRVWQQGFHDHALRKEEDLKHLARYVILNPVRAKLVKSVREYSLWDAMWL